MNLPRQVAFFLALLIPSALLSQTPIQTAPKSEAPIASTPFVSETTDNFVLRHNSYSLGILYAIKQVHGSISSYDLFMGCTPDGVMMGYWPTAYYGNVQIRAERLSFNSETRVLEATDDVTITDSIIAMTNGIVTNNDKVLRASKARFDFSRSKPTLTLDGKRVPFPEINAIPIPFSPPPNRL
jgi:hypothetical protein